MRKLILFFFGFMSILFYLATSALAKDIFHLMDGNQTIRKGVVEVPSFTQSMDRVEQSKSIYVSERAALGHLWHLFLPEMAETMFANLNFNLNSNRPVFHQRGSFYQKRDPGWSWKT